MIALAVLAVGFYAPMTLLAPLPAATTVPADVTIDAPDLDWPGYGASALGVVELPEVRAQDGSEKALPLASITKVVTALTVLDAHPLSLGDDGPTITMSSADVSYYSQQLAMNGSVTAVAAGERYTQRDLLELTLIKSANNFATSLAVWAFGSEDAFLTAAAAWLAERAGAVRAAPLNAKAPAHALRLVPLAMRGSVSGALTRSREWQPRGRALLTR